MNSGEDSTEAAAQNPRYQVDEAPPLKQTIGLGLQFSLIASVTLLMTPVVVAQASGRGESYLLWMVFASLVVVGISTLIQVRRIGPLGAGAAVPMFTAAFSIPFCITAVIDGGPATLTTLVIASAVIQIVVSKWLFILRRVVTPIVGGTVMMILSITLASVIFDLLDQASLEDPVGAPLTALTTLVIVAALMLRGSALLSLWGPLIGILGGCVVAAVFGIYDIDRVIEAPWVGIPEEWPGLGFDLGLPFWTLLPSFVFLGIIISIQANGASIALQRVAWRNDRAVDFRQVQGTLAGTGSSNLMAGVAGTVPNIVNPTIVSFTQITGVASRSVGYCVGFALLALAFVPKASGLLASIPGPVITGYLLMLTGTLFVDGARTVIQTEQNREKVLVAGVCFWIGASFQFGLFTLPDIGPVLGALFKSGVTTGGFAAIAMILYLELTSPRRMRFKSKLDVEALPELNEFISRFSDSRKWDDEMKTRLSAVAEETLLTLAPLEFDLLADDEQDSQQESNLRQLVVIASSEGAMAELEFIGGGDGENIEDRVRQLQEHGDDQFVEHELSLQMLRSYASSVNHQQYHDTDIITVHVDHPNN